MCCVSSLCVAQIQTITTQEEQEMEIVRVFWWISKQCTDANWTFQVWLGY